MNKTISLILLMGLFGCNIPCDKKNTTTFQEGYVVFNKEQSKISKLIQQQPDSALVVLNNYIQRYPTNIEFLKLRGSLYFSTKEFKSCKLDIEKIITLRPDAKPLWTEMLIYLDCKIETDDDCGDSIMISNTEDEK